MINRLFKSRLKHPMETQMAFFKNQIVKEVGLKIDQANLDFS